MLSDNFHTTVIRSFAVRQCTEFLLNLFGRILANMQTMLRTNVVANTLIHCVPRCRQTCRSDHSTRCDDCDVRSATTNIDDEVSAFVFKTHASSKTGSQSFIY